MASRTLTIAGVATAVLVIAGVTIAATADDSDSATTTPRASLTLQPVQARTLETTTDATGTIGFGTATTVRLAGSSTSSSSSSSNTAGASAAAGANTSSSPSSTGTITGLPAVGTVVQPGQSLAEIDGSPAAFLMVGTRPMWRTLQAGVSDGPDVQQLEQSLTDLGFGGGLTVDETFTSATTAAVERWQDAHGFDATGAVSPTTIVFLPGAQRIASQIATVGASASGEILTVTGTTPVVQASLDPTDVGSVHTGDAVQVDLPDGRTVPGTVFSIATTTSSSSSSSSAQSNGQNTSSTTTGVDVVLPGVDLSAFDGADVTVHLVTAKAERAISVPVKSLLALAEGGYAVQRERDGRRTLVAVKPGVFAGGFVQVAGDIRAGDRVATP